MSKVTTRLGLGTVQFGFDYGVANVSGRPDDDEVSNILRDAVDCGIETIDTAAAYGASEAVLGRCLPRMAAVRLVTKTRPLRERTEAGDAAAWIRDGFSRSLGRLNRESVEGLLVHHAADLLGPCGDAIYRELVRLKKEGLVRKIGLSAYAGTEVDAVLERYDIDQIQIPVNVFDQRLVAGGQLHRLRRRGVEMHVRSVFLQGLLLMDPRSLPAYFEPIRPQMRALHEALRDKGLTPPQGALAFVRSLEIDVVLVGVESSAQLRANRNDFERSAASGVDFTQFALDQDSFLNPSRWKLAA